MANFLQASTPGSHSATTNPRRKLSPLFTSEIDMGLATVQTRAAVGIEAPQVLCEGNLSPGLPMFAIVGLPETAVKESKDRVRAAMKNSEFDLVRTGIL